MRQQFAGTCPKDTSGNDINEDRFAVDAANGRLALCDGASESFDSARWADILATKYVADPAVSTRWLAAAEAQYAAAHDFASMTWSRQAAYERGSFATLLGVEYKVQHNTVEILAVGDSLAVLVDTDKINKCWPFDDPERFREHPTLLSTLPMHNAFLSETDFWTKRGTTFHLTGLRKPNLLCMTDALGDWFLRQAAEIAVPRLLALSTQEDLDHLVVEEREAGRMRIDDTTLLVFSFSTTEAARGVSVS